MHTTRGPRRFLHLVSTMTLSWKDTPTSDLLEALLVLLGEGVVLLLQRLETARQRVSGLCVIVLEPGARLAVIHRVLHLLDCLDQTLRLLCHLMLLVGDGAQLAMERV